MNFSSKRLEDAVRSDLGISGSYLWPLMDLDQMKAWVAESFRSRIWMTSQPFAPPSKLKTQFHTLMEELSKPKWYGHFRYNTLAIALMPEAQPKNQAYTYYAKWNQHKCIARLYLAQAIKMRSLNLNVPINPLTHTPFKELSETSCDLKERSNLKQ